MDNTKNDNHTQKNENGTQEKSQANDTQNPSPLYPKQNRTHQIGEDESEESKKREVVANDEGESNDSYEGIEGIDEPQLGNEEGQRNPIDQGNSSLEK
ncbi:MAG: hypothetical protein IPP32_13765 [Bacteroidetes bacterium]|nr:hypothetical protein [Bacteroidota bacterium]